MALHNAPGLVAVTPGPLFLLLPDLIFLPSASLRLACFVAYPVHRLTWVFCPSVWRVWPTKPRIQVPGLLSAPEWGFRNANEFIQPPVSVATEISGEAPGPNPLNLQQLEVPRV